MATDQRNQLFPIFLKLDQLQTLVVGGGAVGLEKLQALLANSPQAPVRLVAKKICPAIRALSLDHPHLRLEERAYEPGDLQGVQVALLATDDRAVNVAIREQAKALNVLVNVADTPDLCDFYLGSIVQKGQLKIAISTNGQSPTFAKRMRQLLQEALPDETDLVLKNLRTLRDRLKGDFHYKVKKLNEYTAHLVSQKK